MKVFKSWHHNSEPEKVEERQAPCIAHGASSGNTMSLHAEAPRAIADCRSCHVQSTHTAQFCDSACWCKFAWVTVALLQSEVTLRNVVPSFLTSLLESDGPWYWSFGGSIKRYMVGQSHTDLRGALYISASYIFFDIPSSFQRASSILSLCNCQSSIWLFLI